jgi:hypothetical protein
MAFKTFVPGTTLTAGDVNEYLMKQSVIVCTSSTRPSSPVEGMTIYQTDTDNQWFYDGATWLPATGLQPVKPTSATNGTVSGHVVVISNAVTSVTVNGVFSSRYDNYLIQMNGGTLSASTDIFLRMSTGGTASTTGYYGFLVYGATGAATVLGAARNNDTRWSWMGGGVSGQLSHAQATLYNPFGSTYTKITNGAYQNDNNYGNFNGEHRVAASYDGFVLGVDTGTFASGVIRVYGYR